MRGNGSGENSEIMKLVIASVMASGSGRWQLTDGCSMYGRHCVIINCGPHQLKLK